MISAGNHQRSFRQAITRAKRFATEPALSECCGEAVDRLSPDGLGSVKRHSPGAQVQEASLLGSDFAEAEFVRKIRPAAYRAAVARNSFKPPKGLLEKRHRRSQHDRE